MLSCLRFWAVASPITDVAQWVGCKDINVTYANYGHLVPDVCGPGPSVLDAEYAEWSGAE